MSKSILIVDDDPHIRDVILFALETARFTAAQAKDGQDALRRFQSGAYDLIVLDINMPELDGLEVCRQIRKTSDVPILFLSSRDDEIDRIVGLELGADDYLTKPFSPRELVARINAILKRTRMQPQTEKNPWHVGLMVVDPDKHAVTWGAQSIDLTAIEFSILAAMSQHPDMVFNRERILDAAYGINMHVSDRTIDSHVRNIRKKFAQKGCPEIIKTIHGVGYKLSA